MVVGGLAVSPPQSGQETHFKVKYMTVESEIWAIRLDWHLMDERSSLFSRRSRMKSADECFTVAAECVELPNHDDTVSNLYACLLYATPHS